MAQQTYGEWMRSNPPIHNMTAVEWLVKELKLEGYDYTVQQAKQMEKEQMFKYIENLYVNGDASREFHKKEFEQYYNETYKK